MCKAVITIGMEKLFMSKSTDTLNVILGAEYELIYVYMGCFKLIENRSEMVERFKKFLAIHQEHRDALIATINKLGGKPIAEPKFDMAKTLAKTSIKKLDADSALTLIAELERQAAKAYLGVIPNLEKLEIAQAVAKLAADMATHTAILESALKTYKGASYLQQ